MEAYREYYRRRLQVCEREGANGVLVAWSLEEPLVYLIALQGVSEDGQGFSLDRPLSRNFQEEVGPLRKGESCGASRTS